MKLSERIANQNETEEETNVLSSAHTALDSSLVSRGAFQDVLRDLKVKLYNEALNRLDLKSLEKTSKDRQEFRHSIEVFVNDIIGKDSEAIRLLESQQAILRRDITNEICGFGPLEILLNDPDISDILVNHAKQIYIEKKGQLQLSDVQFDNEQHLYNIVQRIISRNGRRIDESSPMVDGRLEDGSRVNAVVPPIGLDGSIVCIRRFGTRSIGLEQLVERKVITVEMGEYLRCAVQSKANLLVSGGTGAGKTTLLNVLSGLIPDYERVITIEDSAELKLQGAHVVRMEARPANVEGQGEVSIRACVRNALRMRPDRVIIGEVRGSEVLDMLQAMNTGHEGSMATVHANTPRDAIDRVMLMLGLAGVNLSADAMAQFVTRTLRVVVQVARAMDGVRRVTAIAEIGQDDDGKPRARSIFSYHPQMGKFVYHGKSGMRERFADFRLTMHWPEDRSPA